VKSQAAVLLHLAGQLLQLHAGRVHEGWEVWQGCMQGSRPFWLAAWAWIWVALSKFGSTVNAVCVLVMCLQVFCY
jgi:hypothetical protein